MELVTGIILGAVLIGFVAMIVLLVRIAFVVAEALVMIKTIYIVLNKLEQMGLATMTACEGFVDALAEAAEQGQNRRVVGPMVMKLNPQDPTSPPQQMSQQEMEELRRIFEDNLNSDDDDEDEPEEPKEPWEGKK